MTFKRGTLTAGRITHLSASTIMSMHTCAKAVYFQKIKGIPSKTQYARTIFGLAIHYAFEQYGRYWIKSKKQMKINSTTECFQQYFKEHCKEITVWGSKDTCKSMLLAGEEAIKLFYEKIAPKLKPESVEVGFKIDRGKNKLPIIGYEDLITEDGCIYDYKCSVRPDPSKYIGNMSIYAWDYLLKTGSMPTKVATIAARWRTKDKMYYFADWEEHVIPITMDYIKYVQDECDDIEAMINAGIFPRAESGCGLCKNCGYRKMCGVVILGGK